MRKENRWIRRAVIFLLVTVVTVRLETELQGMQGGDFITALNFIVLLTIGFATDNYLQKSNKAK